MCPSTLCKTSVVSNEKMANPDASFEEELNFVQLFLVCFLVCLFVLSEPPVKSSTNLFKLNILRTGKVKGRGLSVFVFFS